MVRWMTVNQKVPRALSSYHPVCVPPAHTSELMPRYYFDLVDDIKIHDTKGVSLPNLDAARDYARTFAIELMEAKSSLLGESHAAWSVQVSNGRFERVMKIPFSSLLADVKKRKDATESSAPSASEL
jgi:uncharacterized protein DUF6894